MNGLAKTPDCGAEQIMPRSMTENLQATKLRLESELDKVNEALDALQNNPEVALVLEKVLKVAGRL